MSCAPYIPNIPGVPWVFLVLSWICSRLFFVSFVRIFITACLHHYSSLLVVSTRLPVCLHLSPFVLNMTLSYIYSREGVESVLLLVPVFFLHCICTST